MRISITGREKEDLKRKSNGLIFSVPFGTFMQWYEFSIFGSLIGIISSEFFPRDAHFVQILKTFLIFSASFLLAPLGAMLLGRVGDLFGRKKVLTITIFFMAMPTFIIAILPGYAEIGIVATCSIIICRLLQGFCSGAEFTNSAIYMIESSTKANENLMGCLTSVSYSLGALVGALLVVVFTMPMFPSWFWRVAFLLSSFGAVTAFYIRKKLPETDIYHHAISDIGSKEGPGLTIRHNWNAMFKTFLLASMAGILAYGTFVWLASFLNFATNFSTSLCISISIVAMAVDVIMEPFIAIFIDKHEISGKKTSTVGMISLSILAVPLFEALTISNIYISMLCASILGLLIAIVCAPLNALMTLCFSAKSRCRGFGISFNLGIALLGGTAPLILTYLYGKFGVLSVAEYYIFACCMGLFSLQFLWRGHD